jgi:integrase/recombinase XerD
LAIPLVTIFVRHSADCPHKDDAFYKRCKCLKHLRWSYENKSYRQAAKTRSRGLAEDAKPKLEARFEDGATTATPDLKEHPTIKRAVDLFLESDVLKKYRRELDRFSSIMAVRNRMFRLRFVSKT